MILQGPSPPSVCHMRCVCGDFLESFSRITGVGVQLFHSLSVLIYWAALLTKTERILVLHAMFRPTLKEFLVQEACHGYWTAFLDVKRFDFF